MLPSMQKKGEVNGFPATWFSSACIASRISTLLAALAQCSGWMWLITWPPNLTALWQLTPSRPSRYVTFDEELCCLLCSCSLACSHCRAYDFTYFLLVGSRQMLLSCHRATACLLTQQQKKAVLELMQEVCFPQLVLQCAACTDKQPCLATSDIYKSNSTTGFPDCITPYSADDCYAAHSKCGACRN